MCLQKLTEKKKFFSRDNFLKLDQLRLFLKLHLELFLYFEKSCQWNVRVAFYKELKIKTFFEFSRTKICKVSH